MFCRYCGTEVKDEDVFCSKCGKRLQETAQTIQQNVSQKTQKQDNDLTTAIKILMIVACVFMGFYLIPLAWSIPMTINYFKKVKSGEKVSTGFKVCVLLFISTIAGILLLCQNEND